MKTRGIIGGCASRAAFTDAIPILIAAIAAEIQFAVSSEGSTRLGHVFKRRRGRAFATNQKNSPPFHEACFKILFAFDRSTKHGFPSAPIPSTIQVNLL